MADFEQEVDLSIEISSRELRSAREQIEDALSDIPLGVDAGAASSASRRGRDGSGGGGGGDGAASVAAQTELMRRQLKHQKRSADLDEETGAWLEQIHENTATISEQFGGEGGGQGGGRRLRRWERQRTEDISDILALLQNADLDEGGGGGLLGGGGGFLSGLGFGRGLAGGAAGGGLLARILGGARGAAGAAGRRSPFALLSQTAGMRDVSGVQEGSGPFRGPLGDIGRWINEQTGAAQSFNVGTGEGGGPIVDWLSSQSADFGESFGLDSLFSGDGGVESLQDGEFEVQGEWPEKPEWWDERPGALESSGRGDIDDENTPGFSDLGPGPKRNRGSIDDTEDPWQIGEDASGGRGGGRARVDVSPTANITVEAQRDEQEIVDEVMSEVEAENRRLRSELERALGANI